MILSESRMPRMKSVRIGEFGCDNCNEVDVPRLTLVKRKGREFRFVYCDRCLAHFSKKNEIEIELVYTVKKDEH